MSSIKQNPWDVTISILKVTTLNAFIDKKTTNNVNNKQTRDLEKVENEHNSPKDRIKKKN